MSMKNITNWIIAVFIVVLLSGAVYWVYNWKNPPANANNNNTSSNTNSTTTASKLTNPISADDWTIGPDNAQIQLVEYSDFQCPACRSLSPIFISMVDKFPGQVSLTYRHFPLDFHENAMPSAEIAEAAGAQGKFWEMAEYMLANDLNQDKALEYASSTLGLDVERMKAEIDSKQYQTKINTQKAGGAASGVPGTPAIFLNGELLEWDATTDIENTIKSKLGA